MDLYSYQTNVPFEIGLDSYSGDSVVVEHIQTKKKKNITPFTKGNGKTYFRYSTSITGAHKYTYNSESGGFTIIPYRGSNTLYKHGGVTILGNELHLRHTNDTPFFWLADTWWYGATNRARLNYEFAALLAKRKNQHFSVVQIVIGIPPEADEFSKESENSGGKPFLKDWSINPFYFDEVDKKIQLLIENGIVPCITGGWGHHIDWMGSESVMKLWQEIIARYSASPVVFCLTGEVNAYLVPQTTISTTTEHIVSKMKKYIPNLVWNSMRRIKFATTRTLTQSYNELLEKRIKKWQVVGEFIKNNDPFKRLLTVHITGKTTAYDLFGYDNTIFSINTIQSSHDHESVSFMVQSLVNNHKKNIPFLNMEPWYEGILGNFGAYHQRLAFWVSILCGGIGHTYGAHGIWQMARDDNFMNHWGDSSWQKALKFTGAIHLGRAKQFLGRYEWWKLRPDFPRIEPCWHDNRAEFPIVGQIENKHTFIYFPDKTAANKFILKKNTDILPCNAALIDPSTMKVITDFQINKTDYVVSFRQATEKDVLLVVNPL